MDKFDSLRKSIRQILEQEEKRKKVIRLKEFDSRDYTDEEKAKLDRYSQSMIDDALSQQKPKNDSMSQDSAMDDVEVKDTASVVDKKAIDEIFEKSLDNLLNLEVDFYKNVKLDVSQILFLVLTFEKYKSLIESTKYNKNKLFKNNVKKQQFLKKEDDQSPLVESTDNMQNKLAIVEEVLFLIRKYVIIDIVNGNKIVSRGPESKQRESEDEFGFKVRKVEKDNIKNLFNYFSTSAGHVFEYLVFDALNGNKVKRPKSYYNGVYQLYAYFMIKRHGSFASNLKTYITQESTEGEDEKIFSKEKLLNYFERNFLSGGIDEMDNTFYQEEFKSKESALFKIRDKLIEQIKEINPLFSEDNKYQFVTHEKSGDTYDVNIKYDDNVVFQFDIKTATTPTRQVTPTADGIYKSSYMKTLRDKNFIGYGILTVDVEEDLNEHYVYKLKRFAGGGITKGYIRDNLDICFISHSKVAGKDTSPGGVLRITSFDNKFEILKTGDNDFYEVDDHFGIEITERKSVMSNISKYFGTYILQNEVLKSKLGLSRYKEKKYIINTSQIENSEIKKLFENIIDDYFYSGSEYRNNTKVWGKDKRYPNRPQTTSGFKKDRFDLSNFYKIYNKRGEFPNVKDNVEKLYKLIQEFVDSNTGQESVIDSHNRTDSVISETLLRNIIKSLLQEADKKSYSGSHPEESYGWSAKEEHFMFDMPGLTTWEEDRQRVKEYLRSMGMLAPKKEKKK